MRTLFPVLVCGLALLLAMSAARAASRTLLLELWLDGKNLDRVVTVTLTDGHLFLSKDDLAAMKLGLALPAPGADGLTDLSTIAGLTVALDESDQRLNLSVPLHALPPQLYDLALAGREAPTATAGTTGAVLHYDLSGTANDAAAWGRNLVGGGELALDVFTPSALINATGFANGSSAGWTAARLDTSVIFDDPDSLQHLSLGDAITSMPAFARAVRFGGIELARDFYLRPDLDTRPLPQFFGQTAVPATVDVFSGAAQVFEQKIDPGPFTLNNLPIVSGGGTATIVTRDVLGREVTQTLSLYTGSDLLAPGLSSYAVDLGFLRTYYGIQSLGYDTPVMSASWRRGFSGMLTLEGHGEASPHQGLMSGGAALGVGNFGELSGDVAASGGAQGGGVELSLNAQARAGRFSLFASGSSASALYRDLASLDGGTVVPRFRYQFGLTTNFPGAGTLGLSWIGSKNTDEAAEDLLSASWTVPLPRAMFLAVTGLDDLQSRALSAQVSLNVPMGDRALGSLTGVDENGRDSALAEYDNPADADGGFGYRLLTGWEDGGRFEGDGTYIGPHGEVDGGVSVEDGKPALRGDVDGALVFVKDQLYAVHDPGDAVALVETGDPHVRIYRENRIVAVSDDEGEALITGLNSYAPNHIALEPRDFSFDTLVEKTDMTVTPRRQSGVLVDLKPRSHHPLLAMVVRADGTPPPVGAKVLLDGDSDPLTVGHDGEVFIADLDHAVGADVEWEGSRCRVYITPAKNKGPMPRTDALRCLREADGAY